uniref:Uncharacterized protein n=1 Tax=Salix viminalis TaxID=40686 RepID=A0A6N2MRX2_SALVM
MTVLRGLRETHLESYLLTSLIAGFLGKTMFR